MYFDHFSHSHNQGAFVDCMHHPSCIWQRNVCRDTREDFVAYMYAWQATGAHVNGKLAHMAFEPSCCCYRCCSRDFGNAELLLKHMQISCMINKHAFFMTTFWGPFWGLSENITLSIWKGNMDATSGIKWYLYSAFSWSRGQLTVLHHVHESRGILILSTIVN